jgi:pimeloyl-ACP methyl ester carboxylesterase
VYRRFVRPRLNSFAVVLGLMAFGGSGCWSYIEDHCPGCTIFVEARRGKPPPRVSPQGGRVVVVLVHGAFGFGPEWAEVTQRLRDTHTPCLAFSWRGPWHELDQTVRDLSMTLQAQLDADYELETLLVLGHSAGGPLAQRAARYLRVPPGRHVEVVELDSPTFMNGAPFYATRLDGPMPPGVEIVRYLARPRPKQAPDDPHLHYLGRGVSHQRSVPLASLPILDRLLAPEVTPPSAASSNPLSP